MDRKKRNQLVVILAEAFRQTASAGTLAAYEVGLAGVPDVDVERAVHRAIRECRFMPTAKELRELASGLRDGERAVLAWQVVLGVRLDPYRHVSFDDPIINATIRNMGGWPTFLSRLTDTESEKWARKDFIDAYTRLHASGVNADMCRPLTGLAECSVRDGNVLPPVVNRITTGLPVDAQRAPRVPPSESAVLLTLKKP
jgi:hypothetical protein